MTQTIEGPKEEPIFLRVSVGITRRWTNDHYFFGRKDALAKRVLAIALTKRTTMLNSHADKKME
jgi:hypothetical protein